MRTTKDINIIYLFILVFFATPAFKIGLASVLIILIYYIGFVNILTYAIMPIVIFRCLVWTCNY